VIVSLEALFTEFCHYLNGTLYWTETKDSEWTKAIWRFFSERNSAEPVPYEEAKNYMTIDYTWRYKPEQFSIYDVVLAVEHEGIENEVNDLTKKEVQHLIDIKARNKIGIFYPRLGDERELLREIERRIQAQSPDLKLMLEKYLIILGYATTKQRVRAILFKGFIFNGNGILEKQMEDVVFQAPKL
jgi:hypothetical protein